MSTATAAATSTAGYTEATTWTLVGTGELDDSGDGGHPREAAINQPRAVSALRNGGYAWAEPYANRIRAVGPNGVVTTLAGSGEPGSGGDGGKATLAELNFPHTATPTPDGGFLIADTRNSRIRKVSAAGIITTVAGTGVHGFGGDGGPAVRAELNNPRSVVSLDDGGFLIPDSNNHRIRKVSPTGVITTVAGTGSQGFSGDGGLATNARLSVPFAVAPTADGGFLIADIENERIRKVAADGIITTVAGNGTAGFSGDGGPATAASLQHPHAVLSLADGGFLISDTTNERVRQVSPDGIISTVIGDGTRGSSGDGGPARLARLGAPKGISLTDQGDLLIADEQNNRIRFVGMVVLPTNLAPPSVSGDAVEGRQLVASSGVWHGTGPQLDYRWQRCRISCENITGASGKVYTVSSSDVGAALRIAVTATNPAGALTIASSSLAVRGPGSAKPDTQTGNVPATPGDKPAPGTIRSGAAPATWIVRASSTYQRAHEYTVRARNSRLSDAIKAYGATPSCKVTGRGRVLAIWAERGIRVDGSSNRPLPRGKTGCSAPELVFVSEIRLTDGRWMTSLGLRVGDTVAKLRRLYPRSPLIRPGSATQRTEYYLVWRHASCRRNCTPQTKRYGVNSPRLTAQVANGKVVALRLPVLEQNR